MQPHFFHPLSSRRCMRAACERVCKCAWHAHMQQPRPSTFVMPRCPRAAVPTRAGKHTQSNTANASCCAVPVACHIKRAACVAVLPLCVPAVCLRCECPCRCSFACAGKLPSRLASSSRRSSPSAPALSPRSSAGGFEEKSS